MTMITPDNLTTMEDYGERLSPERKEKLKLIAA